MRDQRENLRTFLHLDGLHQFKLFLRTDSFYFKLKWFEVHGLLGNIDVCVYIFGQTSALD